MSFASEDIRVMNSTQHSIKRSRASFAKVWPDDAGIISVIIFCTVAVGGRYHLFVSQEVNPRWGFNLARRWESA